MLYNRASVRTVAPTDTPVSLAEVKRHVGAVDFTDDDDLLTGFIAAATEFLDGVDGYLGRALVTQTWAHKYARWAEYEMRLALPGGTVSSVKYLDIDEVEQTLSTSLYQVVEDNLSTVVIPMPSVIWPAVSWTATPITITAQHGTAAADVPAAIKQAMFLIIGDWYANRENVADKGPAEIPMPFAARALLQPYRRTHIAA